MSDSNAQAFETNAKGTSCWDNVRIAVLADSITFGPLVITPSISKKQAMFDYNKRINDEELYSL